VRKQIEITEEELERAEAVAEFFGDSNIDLYSKLFAMGLEIAECAVNQQKRFVEGWQE
jgi:hypothetical protein